MIASCEHVYAYYQQRWKRHHCIAYNYLRRGYYQAARGIWTAANNLFSPKD